MCFAGNHVEEWVGKFSSQTLPFKLATVAALFMLGKSALWHFHSDPLKAFPGPFLARYTNLWRLVDYYQTTQARSHRRLHDELGPAVRIGPDMVILNDPALLKTVYSTRGDFVKSDFYEVGDTIHDGYRVESVFTTRSNHLHARYMKPYQKYFKMDIILSKEHLLDDVVKTLCQQLERRFVDGGNGGKTADVAEWIEYAAWDLDWQMTFSEDFGFLKTGTDVQGMIRTGETIMRYLGCVGQMPFLDRLLGKNKYCPIRFATFEHAAAYSFGKLAERSSAAKKQVHGDFLDNFLEEKEQHPDIVTNNEIVGYLMMNVLAGGDTTAIVQKAIAWYVLSHPHVHQALVAELDAARLSFPPRYEETRSLPYLDAVIREGQRMHPVITGILERIVPGPGLALPDGRIVPAGTKVGINPWVSSRDRAAYGDDADDFRPERWLREAGETEAEYAMRLRRMKDADFTFGGGRRACVGRNMAAVELHKVTATLFSRYNIELDRTRKQWSQKWWWFSFVDHIQVKMTLREGVALT